MKNLPWRRILRRKSANPARKRCEPCSWTPRLERLEDRCVPTITVTNQAILPVEGLSENFLVATFTDTDPSPLADYSATIDWGDGSPTSAGTITQSGSTFSVSGTHTYADESATLPVTVQIQENNGADQDTGTANSTADPAEADSFTPGTIAISVAEGANFNGTVATFTDSNTANVASDFTASIDWGDGSTATGTVSGSAGNFAVSGSHTYAEDGSFSPTVTLTDTGGVSATATGTAVVTEADLTAAGTVSPSVVLWRPFMIRAAPTRPEPSVPR